MVDQTGVGENRHKIRYKILNHRPDDPARDVEVHATPEEIKKLAEEGYLVRENFFKGESLEKLRNALDRLEAKERNTTEPGAGFSTSRNFGGLFLRYLMDKEPEFFELLKYDPMLSVARAMMGPQVQMGLSARISYPGEPNQETIWHQHLRYVPNPLPPWFVRPHCLDVLVYLDDVDDATGPICVMPGSHNRLDTEPPADCFDNLPGQVVLKPTAGTALFMHANLWHRAMPTTPAGRKRRLLLFGYYPTWLKRGLYGVQPANGLTRALLNEGDPEKLELLGQIGYM